MNRNSSFVRKVAYITAIALLLLPLSALSQPATIEPNKPDGGSPGGKLSQLRTEYNLAQAELGEIDPASETMKLATLGMRGVAANILWIWANHYKKVEDWDKLELTVQQIIRLQPNFLEVWDFQAHNLSYNVSVEFDDYRMRYQWVKKGIDFLILGTHYNRQEPGLLNQVGWYTGQKVGRSDEQKQFRRMFKDDKDFHQVFRNNGIEVDQDQALGPDVKPDNWLVARLWFNKATDAVTFSGKPIRGKSPLLFYSGGPMSQINGSAAMQKDGYFFQRAQIAWQKAADEWSAYGNRELPATAGYNIRLNDYESMQTRIKEMRAEVDQLAPGVRDKIRGDKVGKLAADMKAAFDKPADQRTPEEVGLAYQAEFQIGVTDREVLEAAPRDARPRLRTLVDQIEADSGVAESVARNRGIVNFEYWQTRCLAEKTDIAQGARKDVHDADLLFAAGEKFDDARQMYERSWDAWSQIFDDHPILMDNAESQDLIESIERYRDLLGQLDEKFPLDFKLNKLLDKHYEGQQLREQIKLLHDAAGGTKPDDKKPEDAKPEDAKPDDAKPDGATPDDAKSDEAKPDEKKPADPKPTEAKPDDGQPADVKPTAEKPAAEKPAAEKPAAEKPAEEKPAAEKPAGEKPAATSEMP
jgi:hypothetical protein